MSYRIFFSHSGTDKKLAQWVARSGSGLGIEVYLFEHDPQPGRELATKIQQAIQLSDALVVLLSASGHSSPYVQQEIGFAMAKGRLVIPLVWPEVQQRSLAMLAGIEYVPFDPHDPNQSLVPLWNYLQKLKNQKEGSQAILAVGALVLAAIALSGKG
jgi:hypothetical protein